MKLFFILSTIIYVCSQASARDHLQTFETVNVHKYSINLEINDSTNSIKGIADLNIMLKKATDTLFIDLASLNREGKGMIVDSVLNNGISIDYLHRENKLILPANNSDTSNTLNYKVFYYGIPRDGMIISNNLHGDRTFFSDNWPNRAHNWFPCFDHPAGRAMVDFTITAPSHYQVIATGILKKKVNLPKKRTTHYWSSAVPVPTKAMVFAAAGFAVEFLDDIDGIPYSNWVYSQNMEEGFYDFAITPDILRFYTALIGPYPFEKIANVQSTTRYGGIENAGNIFYNETAIKGDRSIEYTIVHEMAHQWFGNSVSEKDWPHLWLSEGLATWLTDIYIEKKYGADKLKERLINYRKKIIDFSRTRLSPVVDNHEENFIDLLNPNTHEKAAWVLHMLSMKIGRDKMIEGLVVYYNQYKFSNATSGDFIKVMEDISGVTLEEFADDWLYSAGHPVISLSSGYGNGRLVIELVQTQQHKMAFTFPVEIKLIFNDGTDLNYSFDVIFRRHEFVLDVPSEPVEIIIDPEIRLLYEQI